MVGDNDLGRWKRGANFDCLFGCVLLSPKRGMTRLGGTTTVALYVYLQNGRMVNQPVYSG